jgi:C-terminal processing protease CtpA/Prc
LPKPQEYSKLFKGLSDTNIKQDELYKESGRALNCVPRVKTFKGKVYILTDSKTSKTSEVLAAELQKEKTATLVGQKTTGSTLLLENLTVNEEYDLFLPVADFYNSEGKNVSKTGIEPDKIVAGEDALTFILKNL